VPCRSTPTILFRLRGFESIGLNWHAKMGIVVFSSRATIVAVIVPAALGNGRAHRL
jgi:hypothetical protein